MILYINIPVNAEHIITDMYSKEYAKNYNNYILQRQKYCAVYFNALQLTKEQYLEYEKICSLYTDNYIVKFELLFKEIDKYNVMSKSRQSFMEIREQKRNIKSIYKSLKQMRHAEYKSLKNILTKNQREKLKLIRHLEIHDIRKSSKAKDYYKSNPQMSVFGGFQH